MNFYRILKESIEIDNIKNKLEPSFNQVLDSINDFIDNADESNSGKYLDNLKDKLQNVITIFNQLGITYEPDVSADVDEDTFKTSLERYSNSIKEFMKEYSQDSLEAINSLTRNIEGLVEIHRTNYIDEGEVLNDE